ncbi:hypothetical protein NP493_1060g00032 [Ridgeia piscesae]|uniref:Uncharacterized protein n=1 Tax=Ridgeia piscesae TaxID=27915 RepID=A0AAD9KJ42_RIDPI|nr:hypothetical protein NP493_1060g00032 [Ridgeia piscesae]
MTNLRLFVHVWNVSRASVTQKQFRCHDQRPTIHHKYYYKSFTQCSHGCLPFRITSLIWQHGKYADCPKCRTYLHDNSDAVGLTQTTPVVGIRRTVHPDIRWMKLWRRTDR